MKFIHHTYSRDNADTLTMVSIKISQKEIEEKICKLKVRKATGPDGVSARLLKSAGMSIAPSLKGVFEHSAKACKPPDQWKIARVSAAFKKGREEDRTFFRPLSMLSIPSKLMESCVADTIINHVVTQNLLDSRQWAYRKGKSTEQLLIHLTERWREAVEKKLYVGILFVDFTKAFDTVSHNMLLQKINDLGIRGDLWQWIKNYLTERRQFVRINGCDSDTHIMTHGVPQGSVLGPTLFSLFTNDLPKSLRSAETYLYADDTTIYCIAETMDLLTNTLNHALAELQKWCERYLMVPHPEKCKAMIVQRQSSFIGPIQALRLGKNIIKWTTSERLLGVQVDDKLSWSDHAANVAKSFASKLSLLRCMRFLPRKQLEDFYTKVILPSVTYGLIVWGSCNKTHLNNLEKLHARAGRIVYGLPWDISAEDVLTRTGWDSLETMYKVRLTEFVFKCMKGFTVTEFKDLFVQRNSGRRRNEDIILPRPETNFIRNSIRYRGAIAWNSLSNKETTAKTLKDFKRRLRKFDTDEINFQPMLAITKNRIPGYKYF